MRRLATRARSEDGFTLPELLTSISIALIVSLATFSLIEFTIRRSGEVQGRVEATQKGRAAMDVITQHMRSQVCLSSDTPPLQIADANQVTFYTDLSDGTQGLPPEKQSITYDPAARTLIERDFVGTRQGQDVVYPASPTRVRTLAENVVPATAGDPIFKYYAFDEAVDPPRPTVLLATPLVATDRARAVRVEINFRALPPQAQSATARGSILLHDEIYVRAADPDDPRDVRAPDPTNPNAIPPVCT
jgi:prepilin-type N-terminal cleavage/methylation domain-containing protein